MADERSAVIKIGDNEYELLLTTKATKEIAKKRIVGRLSCTNCGAVYNDQFEESKPKNLEVCDLCNNTLSKREDDNEEVFDKRYDTYV